MNALLSSSENWEVVEDSFDELTNTTNWSNVMLIYVSLNGSDDLVLEDLMKIHEAIALENVGTMIKLKKMWRFGVSRVDQLLCV